MKILAIETSCDETSVSIVIDGRVKSNIVASQAFKLHAQYGGVVPEVAAREHVSVIIPTINLALKQAKIKLANIDCIAVTKGPGLATALMVGVDTAKALGLALHKPVLPINHLEGHIYANFAGQFKISNLKSKIFPAIILTVSGGHTFLTEMKGHGQYRLLGETLDDAAGEAFDKTARMVGLGYPGGAQLSKLAEQGNPAAFDFPRPMIKSDNFAFSFSGLKTAVLYKIQSLGAQRSALIPDLAASVQAAIVDVLIAKLEKAIIRYKPKTIMLGGGVAANKLLRKRFQILASRFQIQSSIPSFEYCTDNAAMIGLAAHYRLKNKKAKFPASFSAQPNLPLK
ncbi:MAG: tRNA (adenosine(37)-N6)-threonylcarbamoyltransferase complex transferase subunit TsaD [Candidatus Doudnabacteria bacterium RIFCSPLOWO2_02_FULL_49_13]|uniref:tRNA N6-adenosine threonylcarbamoyltransferase n=1 Tax=Candidatus Doudnabacteria bacterium RIFCSPHIGHO2_12_FULL_48_16 TaxID=1817838 RepID=A0A1F5PJY7_9BACT|nr:MAG: tRNA (adenosine(37)-N6)-threonylcarbamoyltransferase complex transferase subunit TsaD [Candidatus Doudnabacteria bacterium RIFCSPHIGHO2_02_FULL_49_24]OGE88505.1 MAG: tRNA (adenosine(37)-N6)-threonylcarbamoyltransferase complex transferase subunit TsaD [Candidatus Doudnabacteria bacterium RIFCSPHIGHO2_01_FULL_50_67]OGE90253.1 MAG: tRNA (adenosine(37)-N6)-threonylcarbamoyltransferase complex transferase subunit TsaD [Candidatus Doudnabacteria bacterium RIFCSPHIGHO2_12_FULL_48_16]OGE96909.1